MRAHLSISNSNSKREKKHFYYRERTKDTNKKHARSYLFAHVQLELLHGRVVELQTAHELVRLERHDDCAHKNAQRKWNFSTDTQMHHKP